MVGTQVCDPAGIWTSPTPISDLDPDTLCPHIISMNVDGGDGQAENLDFYSSEFHKSLRPHFGNISDRFFAEFANCLNDSGLANVIGLKLVRPEFTGKMIEFAFDDGSLWISEEKFHSKQCNFKNP